MSAIWVVVFLSTLLTALNSLIAIGLVRQVGVLHLRLRPLPALETENGPRPGDELSFAERLWDEGSRRNVKRVILSFVSPTCGLCEPLLPGIKSLATSLPADEQLVLVMDTKIDRAREYLAGKGVSLPFLAAADSFTTNKVPGAPYVVVADRAGRVLASGGINSLEQIEWVIDKARLSSHVDGNAPGPDEGLALARPSESSGRR